MSDWTPVHKAVRPSDERERKPTSEDDLEPDPETGFHRLKPGRGKLVHPHKDDGPERMEYEALAYDFLLERGWEPRDRAQCVMWDDWWHPLYGEHDALTALLKIENFDHERYLSQIQDALEDVFDG